MELRIDAARNIARIRITGPLDKQDLLRAFDTVVADKRYRKGMSRLWDYRGADLSALDSDAIADLTRQPMKYSAGVDDVKVAFVVGRKLEYGLSRMFEAFSADGRTSIDVFYDMEEAEAWLTDAV